MISMHDPLTDVDHHVLDKLAAKYSSGSFVDISRKPKLSLDLGELLGFQFI